MKKLHKNKIHHRYHLWDKYLQVSLHKFSNFTSFLVWLINNTNPLLRAMKFGEHLAKRLTPEWRIQYIQYEHLKTMLYDTFNDITLSAEENDKIRQSQVALKKEIFFNFCMDELMKVKLFFKQKLAEALTKWRDLSGEVEELQKLGPVSAPKQEIISWRSVVRRVLKKKGSDEGSMAVQPKTFRELKTAFAEYYLSLVLLQNYQELNRTGFRKILKKHDKLLNTKRGGKWFKENVENSELFTNKDINDLIKKTETAVTDHLEGGNRKAAMKRLRVPPLHEVQSAWTTFRLGLFLGCFITLGLFILITIIIPGSDPQSSISEKPRWVGVRLFRGMFLLFANLFLMGVNMHGWQSNGVNHVLIFEIEPRNHLTYQSLMEISSFFLMLWAMCVLGFLKGELLYIPSTLFPLLLVVISLAWLFNPFSIWHRSSRFWFAKHVFYCFTAPFHKVTFPDFWLADQMTSLATFFLDMEYLICFYIYYIDYTNYMNIRIQKFDEIWNSTIHGIEIDTGVDKCMSNIYGIRPVVACLPALIRFLQCLRRYRDSKQKHPHLTNAGKYSTVFFINTLGSLNTYFKNEHDITEFIYVWIIAYIVSFVYTYTWDIKMDWGLLDNTTTNPNHKLLRDDLMYGHRFYYYVACVEDFILRLAWVINVSLGDSWLSEVDVLMLVTAVLECFRRFIWNFFRLENEHLNNCGQFRAVRDINVAPILRQSEEGATLTI